MTCHETGPTASPSKYIHRKEYFFRVKIIALALQGEWPMFTTNETTSPQAQVSLFGKIWGECRGMEFRSIFGKEDAEWSEYPAHRHSSELFNPIFIPWNFPGPPFLGTKVGHYFFQAPIFPSINFPKYQSFQVASCRKRLATHRFYALVGQHKRCTRLGCSWQ